MWGYVFLISVNVDKEQSIKNLYKNYFFFKLLKLEYIEAISGRVDSSLFQIMSGELGHTYDYIVTNEK